MLLSILSALPTCRPPCVLMDRLPWIINVLSHAHTHTHTHTKVVLTLSTDNHIMSTFTHNTLCHTHSKKHHMLFSEPLGPLAPSPTLPSPTLLLFGLWIIMSAWELPTDHKQLVYTHKVTWAI